jgi:hypothetical protein
MNLCPLPQCCTCRQEIVRDRHALQHHHWRDAVTRPPQHAGSDPALPNVGVPEHHLPRQKRRRRHVPSLTSDSQHSSMVRSLVTRSLESEFPCQIRASVVLALDFVVASVPGSGREGGSRGELLDPGVRPAPLSQRLGVTVSGPSPTAACGHPLPPRAAIPYRRVRPSPTAACGHPLPPRAAIPYRRMRAACERIRLSVW